MTTRSIARFILKARYRSEVLTRWRYGSELIQVSTASRETRYSRLFDELAGILSSRSHPRVLSFGCSEGDDLRTLASHLPGEAVLTGVDLNHRALRRAEKKSRKEKNRYTFNYYHGINPEWRVKESYDCILALAVFQKTTNRDKGRTHSHASFPFSNFENKLEELHALLKPGGILVLDHCDYSFSETKLSENYAPGPDQPVERKRPLFDRNMKLITEPGPQHRLFIRS